MHGGRIIRSILSRGRDRAYVQELYAQHGLMMLRKAMSILPDEHDALDALNNACLSLLDKAETRRALPEKSLKRYLVITAEHAAIDILKKKNRENQYVFRAGDPLLEEIPSGEETADEVIIRAAEKEVLAGAIRRLPEGGRGVLSMRYDEGLTHAEIARRIGVKPGSVGGILRRIHERLRNMLEKEEIFDDRRR